MSDPLAEKFNEGYDVGFSQASIFSAEKDAKIKSLESRLRRAEAVVHAARKQYGLYTYLGTAANKPGASAEGCAEAENAWLAHYEVLGDVLEAYGLEGGE